MCGIFGVYGRRLTSPDVDALAATLRHRGPDAFGAINTSHGETPLLLGHLRLSIIDVSDQSNQPMERDGLVLIYNGEVYNYLELRAELQQAGVTFHTTGDTEVVLEGWRRWGVDLLGRLRGMFAFAIFDRRSGELHLARDQFGIKPLWYSLSNDGRSLAFASELKALQIADPRLHEIDPAGLCASLTYLWVPDHLSILKGVHKLGKGMVARFRPDKGLELSSYFDLTRYCGSERRLEDAELGEIMLDSVHKHMLADVPVGAFLSGGLDSSLITAMAAKVAKDINCFTIEWSSNEVKREGTGDDTAYARRLAKDLGLNLSLVQVSSDVPDMLQRMTEIFDEPLGDPAAINVLKICELAKSQGIKVLLSGQGADELFGGYRRHLAALLAGRMRRLVPQFARNAAAGVINQLPVARGSESAPLVRAAKRFLAIAQYDEEAAYRRSYSYFDRNRLSALTGGRHEPEIDGIEQQHAEAYWLGGHARGAEAQLDRMSLTDLQMFLPGLNLSYTDRASMAASLEVRVPFVDLKVVDAAFSLRPGGRIKGGRQKAALKRVARPWLPSYVIDRPKASFGLPLRAWTRHEMRDLIHDLLPSGRLVQSGILEQSVVREMIDINQSGQEDLAHIVWHMTQLELWYRNHERLAPAAAA